MRGVRNQIAGSILLEALVAAVIGVVLVTGVGLLFERTVHQRTTTNTSAAALSLAEKKLEQLLAHSTPNPTAAQCTSGSAAEKRLCGDGTAIGLQHGPIEVAEDGAEGVLGAPFELTYFVRDTFPMVGMKRIVVTVRNPNDPLTSAALTTYVDAF